MKEGGSNMIEFEIDKARFINREHIHPWQYRAVREKEEPGEWLSLHGLARTLAGEYNENNDSFEFCQKKIEKSSVQLSLNGFSQYSEITDEELALLTRYFIQEICPPKTNQNNILAMRLQS